MSLTSGGIKYSARAALCAVGVLMALRVVAVAHDPGDLRRQPLTIEERAECHLAIEQVFWRHRTWPAENRSPKPRLKDILSADRVRQQAVDVLAKSAALGVLGRDPVTPARLQAEMDRIARSTRDPKMLAELFAAVENDPYLIAECLVRPLVADSALRSWYQGNSSARVPRGGSAPFAWHDSIDGEEPSDAAGDGSAEAPVAATERSVQPFDDWWEDAGGRFKSSVETAVGRYQLPGPGPASCIDDTWTPTNVLPELLGHESMWTGSEMIIWGQNSGSRYNPATDTWRPIDRAGPGSMDEVVWTGTEMFVWSGQPDGRAARYNPTTDVWSPVSATNAPSGRRWVSLVWTGQEVILWGGNEDYTPNVFELLQRVNTGGRYNPNTDTWTPTSMGGAPTARDLHSAVWTGTTMIVWGGLVTDFSTQSGVDTNTGGRYNPSTNTWTPTSLTNAPSGAWADPRLVWTGTEMIVWGTLGPGGELNAGGRYNPLTNVWSATSLVNVPEGRHRHTVVWSGTELIVWGGSNNNQGELNSGGRYNPATNTWSPTPAPNAPAPREQHSAIWTGTEMIVWGGGASGVGGFNDGARYNPVTNTWTALVGVFAPRARWTHTATWTGAEMIVWGGFGSPAYLNTRASYAPATDSWTALPTTGAPFGPGECTNGLDGAGRRRIRGWRVERE